MQLLTASQSADYAARRSLACTPCGSCGSSCKAPGYEVHDAALLTISTVPYTQHCTDSACVCDFAASDSGAAGTVSAQQLHGKAADSWTERQGTVICTSLDHN